MLTNVLYFVIIFFIVVSTSAVSSSLWAGKDDVPPENITVTISEDMKLVEFGQKHNLNRNVPKKVFNLTSQNDLKKQVADFGINNEMLNNKVNQVLAIQAEHESKKWFKIPLKGLLWIVFLLAVFNLLRKSKINAQRRKWIYMAAVGIFGIILGSDPSPMGAVRDAIVPLGSKGVIFPPRLIEFGIFLLMVILANKFICSWGCQIGTLQDLTFRFNRDSKDSKGLFSQVKNPFIISNSVRILLFLVLILVAFIWAVDIIGAIDPFKIFRPQVIDIASGLFIGIILVLSLFIYRPWCHFFCPFGLVGWLAEKISFFKIKVDYDKCISCRACSKACPSTVMDVILKQERVIPDCFSYETYMETPPVKAISFECVKRQKLTAGKFDKEAMSNQQ